MASSNENAGIVRQLINRVEELSQAISPSDHVRNNNDSINNIVNGEVRRIFTTTGNGESGIAATMPTNQINNRVGASKVMTAARPARPPIPTSSREERLPIRRNPFARRRNFPNQRPRNHRPDEEETVQTPRIADRSCGI